MQSPNHWLFERHTCEPQSHASGFRALRNWFSGMALVLAFSGCASVPQPLQGNFAPLDPAAATQQDATGKTVRWGGTIAAVESLAGETCFQLVGRSLNDEARPIRNDRAEGRFLACRQGFYEPHVFAQGRSITVTGHVVGYETRKVGDFDYRQPKVAADIIYLWPKRQAVQVVEVYYGPTFWWRRW